jgi:subtilase family serine protease
MKEQSSTMRTITASVLVLVALLAVIGSAVSAFAKAPSVSANPLVVYAHTHFKVKAIRVKPFSAGAGFTPKQFDKAYGISALSKTKGKGITVAIIDACGNPNVQSDLNTYDLTYGLPATTVKVVTPEGTPCSDPQAWGVETDLDVQMVHAVAPKAHIVLEAAKSATLKDLLTAAQDAYTKQGASVVSMSFGGSEFSGETAANVDGIFSAGVNQGVTFTASSGDSGCGAQYPAASPFVVSVGGTSLKVDSNGSYVSESAWNGSGGGLSAFENRPSYQDGFNSDSKRGIPDVAMVADPNTGVSVYDTDTGGFIVIGGTSVAAPMWAGITVLADGKRVSHFQNADYVLYSMVGNSANYASDFHDVTTGSSGGNCAAGTGYDLVTGLGSPAAAGLIPGLVGAS